MAFRASSASHSSPPSPSSGSIGAIARCGSVGVFLLGISTALLTLGIDWAWNVPDVTITEAIVFGIIGHCLFLPFSVCVSYGATNNNVALLKCGALFGMLSQIFCVVAFGYWVWWTVAGRGVSYSDVSGREDSRSNTVFNLAVTIDVFYFIAMCTFSSTAGAAAKLAQALEASSAPRLQAIASTNAVGKNRTKQEHSPVATGGQRKNSAQDKV